MTAPVFGDREKSMTDPEVTMDDALVNNNLIPYRTAAEDDADPGPVPATDDCHSR